MNCEKLNPNFYLNAKRYNSEIISVDGINECSNDSEYIFNESNLGSHSPQTLQIQKKNSTGGAVKFSRKIKDHIQLEFLEEFFKIDPEWTKSTINFISKFMNLTHLQLYKWGYDQKRKNS